MDKLSGFPAHLLENKIIDHNAFELYRDSNNYNAYHKISRDKIMTDKTLTFQAFLFTGESVIDLTYFNVEEVELKQDLEFNKLNYLIPLKVIDGVLYIITFNPFNLKGLSTKLKSKYPHEFIKIFMSERKNIISFNNKLSVYLENKNSDIKPEIVETKTELKAEIEVEKEMPKEEEKIQPEKTSNNITEKSNNDEEQIKKETIQRLMKQVLTGAINASADEIHFEPYNSSYRVRFKQNNELFEFLNLPKEISSDISGKIKEMAGIEDSIGKPQFGSLTLKINSSKSVDFKISICPLYLGDKIVFNVKNNNVEKIDFNNIGLETEDLIKINKSLISKDGIFIFNGKRRSGKTYSMYSLLKSLNSRRLNIYTIEKNIGFYIDDINQIKISKDFTYKEALDVIEEQDPDVIMIDVIEDIEMLKKVFNLSKSGRMILFSMNFKNNKEVLQYLIQSGISLLDIYTSLKMINSQALMKENCHDCIEDDISVSALTLEELGFTDKEITDHIDLWKAKHSVGCIECNFKKTSGLIALFDVFIMTPEIRELILSGDIDTFKNMISCIDDKIIYKKAKIKFKEGLISIEELKEAFY